jgi:iron complex outermembrane receptor protein
LKSVWTPSNGVNVTNDFYYVSRYRRYHDIYGYQYVPANNTVKLSNFRDISAQESNFGDVIYAKFDNAILNANSFLAGAIFSQDHYYREDNSNILTGSYGGAATVSAFNLAPIDFAAGKPVYYFPKYDTTVRQYGVFVEDRFAITSKIAIVAGGRFDFYNTNLTNLVSPLTTTNVLRSVGYNIGPVYNPVPNVALYAQYAVGADAVSPLSSISAANQAFTLSPGRQIEAGAKTSLWENRVEASVAVYDIVKKNLLAPSPENPAVSVQVGRQSSYGIEGAVSYRPNDKLTIVANGTILKAQYDAFSTVVNGALVSLKGFQPVDVPERSANVRVLWNFLPNWQAIARLQYVGRRFVDATDTTKLPDYYVVDLGLRWTPVPRLKLDLDIRNLLNRVYAVSAASTTSWIIGEPLGVFVTARLGF